jgi:formylmethanofuran dehydrogenase subunit C
MTRLTLKSAPSARLSLDGITPDRLAGLTEAEIATLELPLGTGTTSLGDWFTIADVGVEGLLLEAVGNRLDRIGGGMKSGAIVVEGNAGAYLGCRMSGGSIHVAGSAGYGVACAMSGGRIEIARDVADFAGSAEPGERYGMSGGTVLIGGNAGDRLGDRMKGGLIVVEGDAGSGAAARMVAGTLIIAGALGGDFGVAMHRGSVVALGGITQVPVCFGDSGPQDLVVFRLWAAELRRLGMAEIADRLTSLDRWVGDQAVSGKGELLLPS